MKKECTCKKIVKDDKVTVLYKCKLCKKHDLKVFDKAIELAKAIIELHTAKNVPVPEYKTRGKSVELIIDKNNYKEFVVCDGQNTPLPDYLKAKGYSDYQDWLNAISDKNTQRYFHKGMLEADKELQRVCETCKNNNLKQNIMNFVKLNKIETNQEVIVNLELIMCITRHESENRTTLTSPNNETLDVIQTPKEIFKNEICMIL